MKSGDSAIDRPTLDQLIGTMQNVQAHQGLLVSWAGFKSSVDKEKADAVLSRAALGPARPD